VAVVPGSHDDYEDRHPTSALLVVEVASSSLPRDRLSKARIYAHAGIPEYWIVNLRERVLEVSRDPDAPRAVYRDLATFGPGDAVELAALAGVRVDVGAVLPSGPLETQEI
jgi:Uma2 family endonuclease